MINLLGPVCATVQVDVDDRDGLESGQPSQHFFLCISYTELGLVIGPLSLLRDNVHKFHELHSNYKEKVISF